MFYCAKFQVSNLNFIFLPPTSVANLGDWEKISNNYLIAVCPHIDCVYLQNLEYVALMVSVKHLDMTDRRADMAKSIFFIALLNNIQVCIYFIGSQMFAST